MGLTSSIEQRLSFEHVALRLVPHFVVVLVELVSWLQKRVRPPIGPDTMTNTVLEAIASASAKKLN